MKELLLCMVFAVTAVHASAETALPSQSTDRPCAEMDKTVVILAANGHAQEAETTLAKALSAQSNGVQQACAGLVLSDLAALMSGFGRFEQTETFAHRSLAILGEIYSSDDPVLMRPLRLLASARFEQGKTARAREALKRMRSLRLERPEGRAQLHATVAMLLDGERRYKEAEPEYVLAIRNWDESGKGGTAETGVILCSLGSLYIKERRLDDAQRALDHALTLFTNSTDTLTIDRTYLFYLRGVLHARKHDWRGAEQDLHDALALAPSPLQLDRNELARILTNYAYVLRKNHHRHEAHGIDARIAALQLPAANAIVDVSELRHK